MIFPACKDDEFTCNPGACIPMSQRCDKIPQCSDASDELGCPESSCRSDQYHCRASGDCIPHWWKCDGFPDCVGADDEADCGTGVYVAV